MLPIVAGARRWRDQPRGRVVLRECDLTDGIHFAFTGIEEVARGRTPTTSFEPSFDRTSGYFGVPASANLTFDDSTDSTASARSGFVLTWIRDPGGGQFVNHGITTGWGFGASPVTPARLRLTFFGVA